MKDASYDIQFPVVTPVGMIYAHDAVHQAVLQGETGKRVITLLMRAGFSARQVQEVVRIVRGERL